MRRDRTHAVSAPPVERAAIRVWPGGRARRGRARHLRDHALDKPCIGGGVARSVRCQPDRSVKTGGRARPPTNSRTRGRCTTMSIAITDDHRALADTASDFLAKHNARGAARDRLESGDEPLPDLWGDLVALGWTGLHVPEEYGGSGYGLPELVIVAEELGRAVTPGPFVPTVVASAVIAEVGSDEQKQRWLPGLADGSTRAAVAVAGDVTVSDGKASGSAVVLAGGTPELVVAVAGADVVRRRRVRPGHHAGDADEPRSDPPLVAAHARRRRGRGAHRRRLGARRPGPHDRRRRGGRRRTRVHRDGCRVREAAPPVRPADRHVPGRQAPLRQHARGHRAGHRRRVGRRPGRREGWRSAAPHRGDRRHARGAGGRPRRQPEHPGPRRHRVHLRARRPPLPAPGHGDRGLPRPRAGREGRHRPDPAGRRADQVRRAAAGGRGVP